MLDILGDFLSDATTPELKESVRQAHELFERFGLDTYEQGFEQILMTSDQAESGTVLDNIYNLTRTLQFQLLEQHGLVVTEDAAISLNNIFLKGLLLIPDYDNASSLMDILTMTGDTLEIVAEVIALVTGVSADELLPSLETADPQLLQLMVEKLDQASVTLTDEDVVLKRNRIHRYKEFVEHSEIKQLKLAYLLEHGLDVGHPLMVYLNLIGDDFDEMEPVAIANELVAMCIISSDASDNPRAAIKEHLDQFVSSLDTITTVTILVGELLLKLSAHEKT